MQLMQRQASSAARINMDLCIDGQITEGNAEEANYMSAMYAGLIYG
jgi:hypothetical protein